jgi:hypothetical protein
MLCVCESRFNLEVISDDAVDSSGFHVHLRGQV